MTSLPFPTGADAMARAAQVIPVSKPAFRLEILPGRLAELEAEARAAIVAGLLEQTRSLRREALLSVMLLSSEEGALVFGVSPRHFRKLCAKHGVPVEPLGHHSPRYRLALVAAALDAMAEASRADREAARTKLVEFAARMTREVEALAA